MRGLNLSHIARNSTFVFCILVSRKIVSLDVATRCYSLADVLTVRNWSNVSTLFMNRLYTITIACTSTSARCNAL